MFLPTGRFEQRIAKTEVVELLHVDESPIAKVEAITENVSPQGARVITNSICARGETCAFGRTRGTPATASPGGLLSTSGGTEICCWAAT
jgi:hypothetical protein